MEGATPSWAKAVADESSAEASDSARASPVVTQDSGGASWSKSPAWAVSPPASSPPSSGAGAVPVPRSAQGQGASRRAQRWEPVAEDVASSAVREESLDLSAHGIASFVRVHNTQMRTVALQQVYTRIRQLIDDGDAGTLRSLVATCVRLSIETPYDDIRNTFTRVLQDVERSGLAVELPPRKVTPSRWIPSAKLVPIHTLDKRLESLFRGLFLSEGRVSHLFRVLAWHPTCLSRLYKTQHYLMRGNGPLIYPWRNYVAIVAAARHKCLPLVRLQEREFLINGGDPDWIVRGVASATLPPQLVNLMHLNELLAHQPWCITPDTFRSLLKGKDSWNVGELVHAIGIMVHFYSMAGLVWGCGVLPEMDIDIEADLKRVQQSGEELQRSGGSAGGGGGGFGGGGGGANDNGGERLAAEEESELVEGSGESVGADSVVQEGTRAVIGILKHQDDIARQREGWASEKPEDKSAIWKQTEDDSASYKSILKVSGNSLKFSSALSKYLGRWTMEHRDFNVLSKEYTSFSKANYNWEEDGYGLADQVLEGFAPLVDDELTHVRALTYGRWGDQEANIDTVPFREAVWHYAHRIKGLLDDDYNYREVNTFLTRQIKFYTKKMTCFPQTLTVSDFANFGLHLQMDEKVHIALLATEAAKEGSLTYAMHGLRQYLRSTE